MSWVCYSLVMFFSAVSLYLVVRKSSLVGVPYTLINLAMFGIPLPVYVLAGVVGRARFDISAWQAAVIVVTAVAFSYGGNVLSLKAISISPNPGYSLVLSKSYVLFTTAVSIVLFHAAASVYKFLAIALIVVFSSLIMVDPTHRAQVRSGRLWVLLSVAAFLAWGMLSLSSKYLFEHGVSTMAFLVYVYAIVTLCIITVNRITPQKLGRTTHRTKVLLLGTGVLSTLFNLGLFEAIGHTPNVGYVNAIDAAAIALVTIMATVLFSDELSWRKTIGVGGVTTGLLLLLLT